MNPDELRDRHIRNLHEALLETEVRPPLYETRCARLLGGTAARKLGASIDVLAPGKAGCPYHAHHAQEELFIILMGEGTLRLAGERLAIRAGDVITIPPGPATPHQIINTSNHPLTFVSISTRDQPELVEYPDSGKYLVTSSNTGEAEPFARMHRAEDDLDYWDGEP
jgi:uncharacterized cupin superfamily protein